MADFIKSESSLNAHYSFDASKNAGNLKTAYFIFFLSASFYLYEFILQVAPSVMADSMMQTFNVTGKGFGVISAFYFYAYAPAQLPAGVLFDRYGPRKLMTFAIFLCAVGSAFFASTDSVLTACLGRFLIGIGSAFSFIGVLVLTARWFPPHYFAILAGLAQMMSSVGAICGEVPLAMLIESVGWRQASFILALIGLALSGLFWVYIRDFPHQKNQSIPEHYLRDEWRRLVAVCKHGYTWAIAGYSCAIWTPIAVFAALWGVPYLEEKYQISVVEASGLCSMIWIGIGIGSPLFGYLSDVMENRRFALGLSSVLGVISAYLILYYPDLPYTLAYLVLFVFGVGASGQSVSFAVVKENNAPELVGTASGFNNLAVLIGGAIFQPFVGYMLQHNQTSEHLVNGVPVYDVSAYNWALTIIPLSYLISLVFILFFVKESHPAKRI